MKLSQPVDELGPGGFGYGLMGGEIVPEGGVGLFLFDEELDVLVEVFIDHLRVVVSDGLRFGLSGFGEDDGSVAGRDGGSELVELVVVDE